MDERKVRILEALRYGYLPSKLLNRPFFGGVEGHHSTVQKALTDMNHELYQGEKLIFKPDELNPEEENRLQAVYGLTPAGMAAGEIIRSVPWRDPDRHRFMGGCLDLSFDVLGPENGVIFGDQEEMFAHEDCPSQTRLSKNPLRIKVSNGYYEPDKLQKFTRIETGKTRFSVREDCRGTVGFSNTDAKKVSNKQKLDDILEIFEERLYLKHWGVPNLSAFFAMTSDERIDTCIHYLQGKKHAEKIYFKAFPQFSTKKWKYPKELLAEVYTPWRTVHGLKDIT